MDEIKVKEICADLMRQHDSDDGVSLRVHTATCRLVLACWGPPIEEKVIGQVHHVNDSSFVSAGPLVPFRSMMDVIEDENRDHTPEFA